MTRGFSNQLYVHIRQSRHKFGSVEVPNDFQCIFRLYTLISLLSIIVNYKYECHDF